MRSCNVAYAYGRDDEMERPEVLYLRYDVSINGRGLELHLVPDVGFFSLGSFGCHFKDVQLEARPRATVPRWQDAERELCGPLRDWEAISELNGLGKLAFTLRHFAVANRLPDPVGPRNCVASLSDWTWRSPPRLDPPTVLSPPAADWNTDGLAKFSGSAGEKYWRSGRLRSSRATSC